MTKNISDEMNDKSEDNNTNSDEVARKIRSVFEASTEGVKRVIHNIILLGPADSLDERRRLQSILRKENIIATIIEDICAIENGSCDTILINEFESKLFKTGFFNENDIDLIFCTLGGNSYGTYDEFAMIIENPNLFSKLCVFIEDKYHPLNIKNQGLSNDKYWQFILQRGQLYPFSLSPSNGYSEVSEKIFYYSLKHRALKYCNFTKQPINLQVGQFSPRP